MVKATLASTVDLWRKHWQANPNVMTAELRLVWADIQNEAEGTDNTAVSSGSVSKYTQMFKHEALQAGTLKFKESGYTSLEPIGPFDSFDSQAELLLVQSQLAGLARESENIANKIKLYSDAVNLALTLIEDSTIMGVLMERAQSAERELVTMERKLENAERLAREERDKRISESIGNGNTHGEATGR